MAVRREAFGRTPDGVPVERITLENGDLRAVLLTRGATLAALHAPDREARSGDVVLGFDSLADYERDPGYVGCVVGRVANRIAGARFTLDGREWRLSANEGANQLHGGARGLDRAVFRVDSLGADPPRLVLSATSPDGDQGFPGRLEVEVVYALAAGRLRIELGARSDQRTPVNLSHHAYWNLATPAAADVRGHVLRSPATHYLPTGPDRIPTGEVARVDGTPFDFRKGRMLGERLAAVAPGYDVHLVLAEAASAEPRFAAELHEPTSGRVFALHTTQPGFQLYTGNHLDGARGKGGVGYGVHRGVCLEPQHPPDAVNQPRFPSVLLSPGEVYRQVIELRFSAR